MRYILYILLFLPCLVSAQGVSNFGATRSQDTSKTKGQVRFEAYVSSDTTIAVFLANGTIKQIPIARLNGGTASIDSAVYVTITRLNDSIVTLRGLINGKKDKSDSTAQSGYVTHYQLDTAKANIRGVIDLKLNISDTTAKWLTTIFEGYGINITGNPKQPVASVDTGVVLQWSDTTGKIATKADLDNLPAGGVLSVGGISPIQSSGGSTPDMSLDTTIVHTSGWNNARYLWRADTATLVSTKADDEGLEALIDTKVPQTRQITINGVTQNLTADRTWTIPATDTASLSNRINGVQNNLEDTAAALRDAIANVPIPNLQEVTDVGNVTTNPIIAQDFIYENAPDTVMSFMRWAKNFVAANDSFRLAAFILRPNVVGSAITWTILNDADHSYLNVRLDTAIYTNPSNGEIRVYWDNVDYVVSFLVAPDEGFATSNMTVGSSVNKNGAIIRGSYSKGAYSGMFWRASSAWNVSRTLENMSVTNSGNEITIVQGNSSPTNDYLTPIENYLGRATDGDMAVYGGRWGYQLKKDNKHDEANYSTIYLLQDAFGNAVPVDSINGDDPIMFSSNRHRLQNANFNSNVFGALTGNSCNFWCIGVFKVGYNFIPWWLLLAFVPFRLKRKWLLGLLLLPAVSFGQIRIQGNAPYKWNIPGYGYWINNATDTFVTYDAENNRVGIANFNSQALSGFNLARFNVLTTGSGNSVVLGSWNTSSPNNTIIANALGGSRLAHAASPSGSFFRLLSQFHDGSALAQGFEIRATIPQQWATGTGNHPTDWFIGQTTGAVNTNAPSLYYRGLLTTLFINSDVSTGRFATQFPASGYAQGTNFLGSRNAGDTTVVIRNQATSPTGDLLKFIANTTQVARVDIAGGSHFNKGYLLNPTKAGTASDSVFILNRTTNEMEYAPLPSAGAVSWGDISGTLADQTDLQTALDDIYDALADTAADIRSTCCGGGGSTDWGDIGGTLSDQTDLQSALDGKVDENTAITGATKTKITYDAKGLVTSGADATTADIAPSTDRNYVTDAQQTVIGNTSGTNTGDNIFTASDFNTSGATVSIDYANGQAASGSVNGFLSSGNFTNFTAAYNDKINSAAFSAGQLTLTQQDAGAVTATINDATTAVKGISSYGASDFDVTSGAVAIDYTNGQAASTSTKGFLTSTDWNTFNGKQGALSLTTTGTSGAATLIGNTLNIPQYSGGGGGSSPFLWTQTGDAGPNNNAAETSVIGTVSGSTSITGGTITAGKTYKIEASGLYTTNGTLNDCVVRLKYGSTTIGTANLTAAANAALPISMTNQRWYIEAIVTCRTNGASGTFRVTGKLTFTTDGAGFGSQLPYEVPIDATTTTTVNTTGTNSFDITADWQAAASGRSFIGSNSLGLQYN